MLLLFQGGGEIGVESDNLGDVAAELLMRDTFVTMLSRSLECWFSFTCSIRSRLRSNTDGTSLRLSLNASHTAGSPSSSAVEERREESPSIGGSAVE